MAGAMLQGLAEFEVVALGPRFREEDGVSTPYHVKTCALRTSPRLRPRGVTRSRYAAPRLISRPARAAVAPAPCT